MNYEKYRQDISVTIYNIDETQGIIRKEIKETALETENKLFAHVK